MSDVPSLESRFRGCLLAGAVGDALGAQIEFWSLEDIVDEYGPNGPADLEAGTFPAGSFTDDTQMTLFVAEGLIRAINAKRTGARDPAIITMLRAHWRWLSTQEPPPIAAIEDGHLESWLTEIPGLNELRAPGLTCTSSLGVRQLDDPLKPVNDSKGCGTVMRIAPVGLAWPDDPFGFGCEVAALTHGHPTGQLAAGCLARIIRELVEGSHLDAAVERAMAELASHPRHRGTLRALEHAVAFAEMGEGTSEEVECLGAGWVAEEAIAISVFCALVAPDIETALRLAVTHSGDSDSTGCITGHILGALHGFEAIPQRWLDQLDLREVVDQVAADLYRAFHDRRALAADGTYDPDRYPGV